MRLYITQTVGDGKSEATAFSSRCTLYTTSACYNCDMRTDATLPGLMLTECNPTAQEHAAMLNDAGIEYLKINGPLDVMLRSEDKLFKLESWSMLKNQLARYGVPFNNLSVNSTVKDLAQTMVRRFTLRYELGSDDLPMITSGQMSKGLQGRVKSKLQRVGFQPSNKVRVQDVLQEYMTQGAYKMQTKHD